MRNNFCKIYGYAFAFTCPVQNNLRDPAVCYCVASKAVNGTFVVLKEYKTAHIYNSMTDIEISSIMEMKSVLNW